MKRIMILFAVIPLISSCMAEIGESAAAPLPEVAEKRVSVRFKCSGQCTRSSINAGDKDVRELWVYAFSSGTLVSSAGSENGGTITMELPANRKYDFYALANSGSQVDCKDEKAFIQTAVSFSNWSGIAGIPMSASIMDIDINEQTGVIDLELERLAARFSLRIDRCFQNSSYYVSRVVVKQSASQIFPFSSNMKSRRFADGDYADYNDLSNLNADGEASFYVPENMQGVLLPGNDDPWAKVPSSIPGSAGDCTYLEIAGVWSSNGVSAPLTYRLYLGEDNCSDFNVIRNTERTIVLNLTDYGVNATSWKVDKGSETDWRSYRFDPDNLILIPDGRTCVSDIKLNPTAIQYRIEYDEAAFSDADVSVSKSGDQLLVAANSNVTQDRSLSVFLKDEGGKVRDVLDLVVRHAEIRAPFGVRIGTGQICDIAVDVEPPVSETGWEFRYSSADENVAVIAESSQTDNRGISSVTAAGGGETVLYASYGPCTAAMEAIVAEQDGFFYSGLPGYITGGTTLNATVSPHIEYNLFSPIRLESNSDETVLKVTRTATNSVFVERYRDYAPDYGNICGSSEFRIEPVGPGVATLTFRSDYPYCVRSRMVTVQSETGYYLIETCRNNNTGQVERRGPDNAPAKFFFNASNGDDLELQFTPEVRGAFISDVRVKYLSKTITHPGWSNGDYYSLTMDGAHLNDCVWHLTGRDCKVEIQVTFGMNEQTVVSTYIFS